MLNIMHLAVQMGMLVHQMDVKTAYCWKFNLSHDLHKTLFVLCCDVSITTSVITSEITVWDG